MLFRSIFQTLFRTHPFPIWRTKEILDWVTTGNYLEILDGDYRTRALISTKPCPACATANKVDALVCTNCGQQLMEEPPPLSAEEQAKSGDDPISKAWGDVRSWYKRKFTTEGPWEEEDKNAVEGDAPEKKPPTNGSGDDKPL